MLQRQLCQLISTRSAASATGVATTVKHVQPAVAHNPVYFNDYNVKVTRLPTGIVVASVDTLREMSRLALLFNCGTRSETNEYQGITQRISSALGLGTDRFPISEVGPIQGALGTEFESTYTREHLLLSLTCARENLSVGIEFLGELSQPSYQSWALSDRRIDLDLEANEALSVPTNRIIDLVHKAAYGTSGLGNPLISAPNIVKRHGVSAVSSFAKQYMCSGTAALTGIGVDHETLLRYAADHLNLTEAPGKLPEAAKFRGGEVRSSENLPHTYCAVVSEGANVKDLKGMAVQALLSAILGGLPGCTTGINLLSPVLDAAIHSAAPNSDAQVAALNISYADSGIFGFQFSCDPDLVDKVLRACLLEFRNITSKGVTQEQFDTAKNHLMMYIQTAEDSQPQLLNSLSRQISASGSYNSPRDVLKAVDALTSADVTEHVKMLMKKKLAMAVLGNLDRTPYLQELSVA